MTIYVYTKNMTIYVYTKNMTIYVYTKNHKSHRHKLNIPVLYHINEIQNK